MADYEFTQGNTRPFFAIQVKNTLNNAAVDLTGATVTFYFKHQLAKAAKVSAGATVITDATNGKVEYRWGANDLDVPGLYDASFRITHTDTKTQDVVIEGVLVKEKLG